VISEKVVPKWTVSFFRKCTQDVFKDDFISLPLSMATQMVPCLDF